jgi:hypothetical protein
MHCRLRGAYNSPSSRNSRSRSAMCRACNCSNSRKKVLADAVSWPSRSSWAMTSRWRAMFLSPVAICSSACARWRLSISRSIGAGYSKKLALVTAANWLADVSDLTEPSEAGRRRADGAGQVRPAEPVQHRFKNPFARIRLYLDDARTTSSSSTAAAMDYVQQRVGAARKRTLTGRAKPSSRWRSACARRAFMFAAEDRR